MNAFKYELELARIDSCKYIKDIRKILYEYVNRFRIINYKTDSKYLASDIKHYKLYSKVYYKFTNSSKTELPDKFFNKLIAFQRKLLNSITENSIISNVTYNDILDIFKYTENITIPILNREQFYNLCNIIGDNPLSFRINILVNPSVLKTSGYFNNLLDNKELIILSWMKVNNIPESNTITKLFRKQYKYLNTQKSYNITIAERADLVLAIETIDQLTGEQIVQQ